MDTIIYEHEKRELANSFQKLRKLSKGILTEDDIHKVKHIMLHSFRCGHLKRDKFDISPILFNIQTAIITAEEIGTSRASIISTLLHHCVAIGCTSIEQIKNEFGEETAQIIIGLKRINELYSRNASIETENFRDLLLSFAEDMRVIFIIIADRVNLMRQIKDKGSEEDRQKVATEVIRLYSPLAHKLGLYLLKSELEDLSLKYLEHDAYYMIKEKLNATKKARDLYIQNFIQPIEEKLSQSGLTFHVKGRTKSIHSIWQKMKKQKCQFEGIYDLFAIRIILKSELEKEKQDCWHTFSIITDMYRPNPKRLRDWLSVPKSNGYESLHITVMGPEGKWVEIQIRTERMDEIAEKGLAAHWRYKGVASSSDKLEDWLKDIRQALETQSSDEQLINQFKVDLYSDEVFVFTPKGDLFKLPKGATVLDFAFQIHTNVGAHCSGGKVNGKNVPMRTTLKSGDQVEILTNPSQTPKRDWLNLAITTKAKTKIRQSIAEQETKTAAYAKETLERKFKNKKIEYDEPVMMRLITRLGYKHVTDFYKAIADQIIDANTFIDKYVDTLRKERDTTSSNTPATSAEAYVQNHLPSTEPASDKDTLVLDQNIKGVEYSLAKCCNPIYGDLVFGFVTINRGIKIHRTDCPNAERLKQNHGYRIIPARWAQKGSTHYPITLRVIGHDDIGIVNNLTSIIAKEKNTMLRSIDIKSSQDGLFAGTLTIMTANTDLLNQLIKKLRTVKGVKSLIRI